MFENSQVSSLYFAYQGIKYGDSTTPVGLLTLCSTVSARLLTKKTHIGFNLLKIAPSGAFKSRTSEETMQMVPREYYIALQSDFTLHGIHREHKGNVANKCLFVNDGTLLLSSKAHKAKERIVNGLAEVLSDGRYHYSDFREDWDITGPCTCVFNMTPESFRMYESTLFASTFIYRFLPIHYRVPIIEQNEFLQNRKMRVAYNLGETFRIDEKLNAENIGFNGFKQILEEISNRWSGLAGFPLNRIADQAEALAKSHAALNGRNYVCEDDVGLLNYAERYLPNPFRGNAARIRQLHQQGLSPMEICEALNKAPSYKTTISRVLSQARMDGVID